MLLGNIVNPYFPNNILFSYLHMLPKVFQLVGLSHSDDEIRVGNGGTRTASSSCSR